MSGVFSASQRTAASAAFRDLPSAPPRHTTDAAKQNTPEESLKERGSPSFHEWAGTTLAHVSKPPTEGAMA